MREHRWHSDSWYPKQQGVWGIPVLSSPNTGDSASLAQEIPVHQATLDYLVYFTVCIKFFFFFFVGISHEHAHTPTTLPTLLLLSFSWQKQSLFIYWYSVQSWLGLLWGWYLFCRQHISVCLYLSLSDSSSQVNLICISLVTICEALMVERGILLFNSVFLPQSNSAVGWYI